MGRLDADNMVRSGARHFLNTGAVLVGLAGVVVMAGAAAVDLLSDPFVGSASSIASASATDEPDAKYVGTEGCIECHEQETELWRGSHHDLAMKPATPEHVLGDFNDQTLTHFGETSRMFRDGEKYRITTEGADGEATTFDIKYAFGAQPLQQYLVEFDDGRVQCLPIAWDTVRERWFQLYPDEHIGPSDPLHWTKPAQTWNYMCADCHSTDLHKNFDLASNTYATTYKDINVGCEACHGPGSAHVEWANLEEDQRALRPNTKLLDLKQVAQQTELDVCAKCHALCAQVAEDFVPGEDFDDYYLLQLLDPDSYHADGQILGEVYVYGSFLQARMFREGVRCSDCHDSHSMKLKRTGNALCTQCHRPETYDVIHHHHHEVEGEGSACVSCHMRQETYMVVDPRADHSFRIPRPDLTLKLGVPNACDDCHADKGTQWSVDWINQWYGPERANDPHYGEVFAAARAGTSEGPQDLIRLALDRVNTGPIVRATAVSLLTAFPGESSVHACARACEDPEPIVRTAAVRTAELITPPDELLLIAVQRLDDQSRLVRMEAARVLVRLYPMLRNDHERAAFDRARAEYEQAQAVASDQPSSHLNLGVLYSDLGQLERAESAYLTSLRLDPDFYMARFNLAMLLYQQGRPAEAEEALSQTAKAAPDLVEAHYLLGLLIAEDHNRLAEAVASLSRAARLAPGRPDVRFNYGLALDRLGRHEDAQRELVAAHLLAPSSIEYVYTLVAIHAQREEWADAAQWLERLIELDPNNPNWPVLRERFKTQADGP